MLLPRGNILIEIETVYFLTVETLAGIYRILEPYGVDSCRFRPTVRLPNDVI